jgi:hypothetical protein
MWYGIGVLCFRLESGVRAVRCWVLLQEGVGGGRGGAGVNGVRMQCGRSSCIFNAVCKCRKEEGAMVVHS